MIQPTSNLLGFNRPEAVANTRSRPPSSPPALVAAPTEDHLTSSSSATLRSALARLPEIRPEVVARGTHLAVDLNYPPRELIERLAKLISSSADLSEKA